MRCTPYGYCMCVGQGPATCCYPDCRVGDMLAGTHDAPPAGQQLIVEALTPAPSETGLLQTAALVVSVWLGWVLAKWWGG